MLNEKCIPSTFGSSSLVICAAESNLIKKNGVCGTSMNQS
jgi:hypothetical protein